MFAKIGVTLLVISVLFAIALANSVSTDEQECPQICPALYSPLCASNGKIYKEFVNACEMKASNCRLERSAIQTYVATDEDWCKTELVDLDNLMTKLDNLDLQMPECLKPCTMIYSPVCMSNGKYRAQISNKCVMDTFNCVLTKTGKQNFRLLQDGPC